MAVAEAPPIANRPGRPAHWVTAGVLLVFVLLSLRLFRLIDLHAVNLLYWDQFIFFDAFVGDASAWEVFRWQHGPHRQGLPFLGSWLIAELTSWNTRVDAFYVGAIVCCAAALALWLRRRLAGPFLAADVAIPLLLLTPAQYGIFIHTPNASHGAGPLLLLVLYALAWTLPGRLARYGAVVGLGFLLVHTGFGAFIAPITPGLLTIACLHEWRAGGGRALAAPATCVALSLLSVAVFFVGYVQKGGFEQIEFPEPGLLVYLHYVALMFANLLGVKGVGLLPGLVGGVVAIAVLAVALRQLAVLLRDTGEGRSAAFAILSLTSFTLLYCVTTAVGRMFMGLPGSQSTRYVPLVVPGLLGLYLALLFVRGGALRTTLLGLSVVAMAAATFPMREAEARFMHHLSRGKRIWIERYLEDLDLAAANRAAGLHVYFRPQPGDRIPEKLEYLRRERLNFFAEP